MAKLLQKRSNVYGDEALNKTAVYDWFKRFKNGMNEGRSGRPLTSKKFQHLV